MAKKAYIGVADGTGKNLLNVGVDGTSWLSANKGTQENAGSVTVTSENAVISTDAGGAANGKYRDILFDNGGTPYTLSAEFTPVTDGLVALERFLLQVFDSSGNPITSGVSGWSYLDYYKGFSKNGNIGTFTLPENAKTFRVGFVWGTSPSKVGEVVQIGKIQLEAGSTATAYEPYGSGSGVARKIKKGYVGINGGLTNNIPDGGFASTSGWSALNLGTFTVSGNVATTVASSKWPQLKTAAISTVAGHKYYFRYGIKHNGDSTVLAQMGQAEIITSSGSVIVSAAGLVSGAWNTFSTIATVNDTSCTVVLLLPLTSGSPGAGDTSLSVQWKEVMLVDLTAAYGSGNEPSQEWCDSNIPFFEKDATILYGSAGTARRIKKAYIGIGGVARPCWSGGELAYYGTITPLSTARRTMAATTVGDYALFGGGATSSSAVTNKVEYYNDSLTSGVTASALSNSRKELTATTVGNYALFGGGSNGNGTTRYTTVDAYNKSLTWKKPTAFNSTRSLLAATTVGSYALFGGGTTDGANGYGYVDAYNTSLTRSSPNKALAQGRFSLAATTVGSYALFGGGLSNSSAYSSQVDAYDKSLTRSTPTALSKARSDIATTAVGKYALFGGGTTGGVSNVVDIYDESLTRTTTTLSAHRAFLGATSVGNYAIFAGGDSMNGNEVDVFDSSLTRAIVTALSVARAELAATTVGNYALFGGGISYDTYESFNAVEAFTVA